VDESETGSANFLVPLSSGTLSFQGLVKLHDPLARCLKKKVRKLRA
jgi:hypothetical protein